MGCMGRRLYWLRALGAEKLIGLGTSGAERLGHRD